MSFLHLLFIFQIQDKFYDRIAVNFTGFIPIELVENLLKGLFSELVIADQIGHVLFDEVNHLSFLEVAVAVHIVQVPDLINEELDACCLVLLIRLQHFRLEFGDLTNENLLSLVLDAEQEVDLLL